MPKQKTSARILVADGEGGMREVADLRFEGGEWPVQGVVPAEVADDWMAHLHAETEERDWSVTGISQAERVENSGSLSVHTARGSSAPTLDIAWERPRNGELRFRARSSSEPALPVETIREFVASVDQRQREHRTIRSHQRALLTYEGLPWKGELWLGDDCRLGPPSRFPDGLLGPQIVVVDAMIEGIGRLGAKSAFQTWIRGLRTILSIVLGQRFEPVTVSSDWVAGVDSDGRITDCVIRPVGYVELAQGVGFPEAGSVMPMERRAVTRPGLGPVGIWPDMHEEWVPDDIEVLWSAFIRLTQSKREQLLRAGNAYLVASSMWPDQRSAYAMFLVVACESLKPTGKRHDKKNVYDVVKSLLGKDEAERLQNLSPHPQGTRNRHLHRGELDAGELVPSMVHGYFADPSFDQMLDALLSVTRTCLIEWLRREAGLRP